VRSLAPQDTFIERCQQIAEGKRVMIDADSAPVPCASPLNHGRNCLADRPHHPDESD
jgi:hypothetical protein